MSAPRFKLNEIREVLAVGLIIVGAIATVVWLGFGLWMLAAGFIRVLLFIADQLR